MIGSNFLPAVIAVSKKWPITRPLSFLFVPWNVLRSLPSMLQDLRVNVEKRIEQRSSGKLHPDYIAGLLPPEGTAATVPQLRHIRTVVGQLILGGFDPTSALYFFTIFFLLKNPEAMEALKQEIRTKFQNYDEIEPDALANFEYLNGCLQETLRLNATANFHGTPRLSPGAMVNGEYIPEGVSLLCRDLLSPFEKGVVL